MDRPHDYESITTLDISDKELTELPYWVSECKKLKKLNCDNNQITQIDNLPSKIEELYYNNNPLKYDFVPTLKNIRNYINQNTKNKN
jgi:Leucine-rich repeat (LRR) protein